MSKVEKAQQVAARRYEEYVKACQRVAELIADENVRIKQQEEKIRLATESRLKALKNKVDSIKTPDVQKSLSVAINAERETIGLSSK